MITAKTKITGLIGYPLGHTLSPLMHNTGFKQLGIDYRYIVMPVQPHLLKDAVRGVKALGFAGINVTVPHKENVIPLLDEINEEAGFIGAVNTVLNREGSLIGFNTDGRGFMKSIKEAGIDLKGKKVFIVGAGGVSRAVSYYLSKEVERLGLFDIDKDKLDVLVKDLKNIRDNVYSEITINSIADSDIVINATPLGMKDTDLLPLDVSKLNNKKIVIDMIYWDTPLLKKADAMGCKVLNGLGMLFWQGVAAFEIWTGAEAPVDVMRKALIKGIEGK